MKLFDALNKLEELPLAKQRSFEHYFNRQLQYRLRPLFADLSLMLSIIGAVIYVAVLAYQDQGFVHIHPLVYVYAGIMILLAIVHRTTKVRFLSPRIIYLMFTNMAVFGYLDYMAVGGGLKPLLGLFFFISSVGFITFSIKHTLIIIGVNFLLLCLATSVLPRNGDTMSYVIAIFNNWLAIMCMIVAPASALFNRWLFRNILALQFMLKDTNEQLKETFQLLKSTEDKLIQQQKHQALSHMAAGLLHEVINPANCAIQAINYAKTISRDEQLDEVLADASEHQVRIINIIDDLQSFSKANPGHNKELTEFQPLFESALKYCRNEMVGISVANEIPSDLKILCYPTAFIQVLVNLLLNSAAAFDKQANTETQLISLDCTISDGFITINVRDNGKGIPKNQLPHISDPFYSSGEGSAQLGLGLSICQTILRHHGGELRVESEEGAWTEVAITLPQSNLPSS